MTNLTFKKPECVKLLSHLKSTVDEILTSHRVDVLSIYGGLQRLIASIHPIISHQYRRDAKTDPHNVDVWPFLHEILFANGSYADIIQRVNKSNGSNRSLIWLEKSLIGYTLSRQMSMMLEKKEILKKYYNEECFLLQSQFSSALLTCLRAIEVNDPSLLAEVNPMKLASEECSSTEGLVRRTSLDISCDSGVNMSSKEIKQRWSHEFISIDSSSPLIIGSLSFESIPGNQSTLTELNKSTSCTFASDKKHLSNMNEAFTFQKNIETDKKQFFPNGICKEHEFSKSLIEDSKSRSKINVNENYINDIKTKHSEANFKKMRTPNHGRSASDIGLFLKTQPEEMKVHESKSEDKLNVCKGNRAQRCSSFFFKQPKEGQSLISFLMSHNFNSCTDLDRENAHFNIAETLLSVIEQVKWNQATNSCRITSNEKKDDAQSFTQRVRIRKRATKKQSLAEAKLDSEESLTSGSEESYHADDVDDSSLSEFSQSNLQVMREEGVSLSLASLYSDADFKTMSGKYDVPHGSGLAKSEDAGRNASQLSADVIAINLLRRFSSHILPNASDFDWLSEEVCKPSNKNVESTFKAVEEEYEESDTKQLRGSLEWAPPRPQIISTVHEKPKLLEGLVKQNNRCAGCGSEVEKSCAKRYIFCEYLGKYFCPCCHNKHKSVIPARILTKWDFSLYSVSHFAYDFLSRNGHEPWFHVSQELYNKVSILSQIKQCRVQLHYLRQFIQVCSSETRPEDIFDCPSHWFTSIGNIDSFSILELESAKKKQFLTILQEKVDICLYHIRQCILCQARGFICEVCKKENDILFPFEVQRVAICQSCKASFHKHCFNPNSCPKCARLLQRKKTQAAS